MDTADDHGFTTQGAAPGPAPGPADWAAPESGLDAPARVLATPAAAGASWDTSTPPAPPPILPVPLKPMTFSDILDGAWAIIKARPRTVFGITAVIIVPIELLSAWLEHGASQGVSMSAILFNPESLTSTSGAHTPSAAAVVGLYVGALLSAMAYFFLGGAIGRLVSAWYAGSDMTARQAIAASFKRSGALVGAFFVLLIPKLIAAIPCYLGLVFVLPLFMLTAPAIVIEGLGPIAGALRSFKLVSRRLFPCIGIWALSWIIEITVNFVVGVLPPVVLQLFLPEAFDQFLAPLWAALARFITAPVVVGICVLLYLDLRVRSEGLDLELEATDAFAVAN